MIAMTGPAPPTAGTPSTPDFGARLTRLENQVASLLKIERERQERERSAPPHEIDALALLTAALGGSPGLVELPHEGGQ